MSSRIALAHSDHVDGPFLRAIGSLALEAHELRGLRASAHPRPGDANLDGWIQFADHLIESVDAVLDGATACSMAGNSIPILREGVVVPVGLDYLTKLATKLQRHNRVAAALGVAVDDEPALAV